jgi:hypothetical protein
VFYIFNIPPRLLLYTCCHIPNFRFVASLLLLLYRIVIRYAEIDSEELKIDMEGILQDRWCFCFGSFHFLWPCEESEIFGRIVIWTPGSYYGQTYSQDNVIFMQDGGYHRRRGFM